MKLHDQSELDHLGLNKWEKLALLLFERSASACVVVLFAGVINVGIAAFHFEDRTWIWAAMIWAIVFLNCLVCRGAYRAIVRALKQTQK